MYYLVVRKLVLLLTIFCYEIGIFFQRNSRAFKRGTWTRRKIQSECGMHAMWHNTRNTLPVMVNGRQTGSKKFLVLHTNKNFDQQRTN